jgi:hypothetical protein
LYLIRREEGEEEGEKKGEVRLPRSGLKVSERSSRPTSKRRKGKKEVPA